MIRWDGGEWLCVKYHPQFTADVHASETWTYNLPQLCMYISRHTCFRSTRVTTFVLNCNWLHSGNLCFTITHGFCNFDRKSKVVWKKVESNERRIFGTSKCGRNLEGESKLRSYKGQVLLNYYRSCQKTTPLSPVCRSGNEWNFHSSSSFQPFKILISFGSSSCKLQSAFWRAKILHKSRYKVLLRFSATFAKVLRWFCTSSPCGSGDN